MRATTTSSSLRGLRRAAVLLVAGMLSAAVVANAQDGGLKPVGASRALAVSVPPDPIPAHAGASIKTAARVINPGARAVSVTITSRALSLGNNGKVTIGLAADPRWRKLVHFPSRKLTIPARSYRDIPLRIQVPLRIAPDLYFIGFLVTPHATRSGSLRVINQIGSFITVDVPGPRLRKLRATFDVPSVVFGSEVRGSLQIENIGRAAVRFWGENDISTSPGSATQQQRLEPSLLPTGTSRVISVSGKPAWPVGFVTMKVHLIYPGRTEATTKELTYSKRVLVVNAIVPIVSILFLACASVLWWVRRRRRREPKVVAQLPS